MLLCLAGMMSLAYGSNLGSGWSPYCEEDFTIGASNQGYDSWTVDDIQQYQSDLANGNELQHGMSQRCSEKKIEMKF